MAPAPWGRREDRHLLLTAFSPQLTLMPQLLPLPRSHLTSRNPEKDLPCLSACACPASLTRLPSLHPHPVSGHLNLVPYALIHLFTCLCRMPGWDDMHSLTCHPGASCVKWHTGVHHSCFYMDRLSSLHDMHSRATPHCVECHPSLIHAFTWTDWRAPTPCACASLFSQTALRLAVLQFTPFIRLDGQNILV